MLFDPTLDVLTTVVFVNPSLNHIIYNAFFVVFRTQKGVIVPGVPCGDRENWG